MFKKLLEKRILKSIAAYESIEGWLSPQEAIGLFQTAKQLPVNSVTVEIGSWLGKSTYCIASGISSGSVYAIDPFNADAGADIGSSREYSDKKGSRDLLEEFKNNMQTRNVSKKIQIRQGYSNQFIQEFTKIDFLFIDGDHSIEGCSFDFKSYAPLVSSGGFLAFHDYYPERKELGPTFVINNYLNYSNDFKFYKQYETLWIAKRV